MNTQLYFFGKVVLAYPPDKNAPPIEITVCIYFDKGDEFPVSYIKSEQDLSNWVIECNKQKYKCSDSRRVNSPLLKTLITPLNINDTVINFDAVNSFTV